MIVDVSIDDELRIDCKGRVMCLSVRSAVNAISERSVPRSERVSDLATLCAGCSAAFHGDGKLCPRCESWKRT